jgi:hypothetical protein
MTVLSIEHRVADYAMWKKMFDSDPLGRAASGVRGYAIYRPIDDPHLVVICMQFDSRDGADAFLVKLRRLWNQVGDRLGFNPGDVQARILDEVEREE